MLRVLDEMQGVDDASLQAVHEHAPVSSEHKEDLQDMEDLHHRFLSAAADRVQEHGRPASDGLDAAHASAAEHNATEEDCLGCFLRANGPVEAEGAEVDETLPELDGRAIDEVVGRWASAIEEARESMKTFAANLAAFDPCDLDACLNHQLALVLHATEAAVEVDFVSLVKPFRDLTGRVVQLDNSDRVIMPSNFAASRSFRGSSFVLATAGARVRKKNREQVPAESVRLRKMFRVAVDGAADVSGLLLESEPTCCACGQTASRGNPTQQCPCCLLTWHAPCGQACVPAAAAYRQTHYVTRLCDDDLSAGDLPFVFLRGGPDVFIDNVLQGVQCSRHRLQYF